MIIHDEIIQGSPEWHELKYGKVGGSGIKHLMVNKPIRECAIYPDLLSARFEEFEWEEGYQSEEMARGVMYEPHARSEFERIKNVVVEQIGWAEMEGELADIAGISPDGLIDGGLEAPEFKCPSRKNHMAYLLNPDSLLEDYAWQIADYFAVFELMERLYMVSYRPENKAKPMLIVPVYRTTKIKISAKETITVDEMVDRIKHRLTELALALKEDVEKYSKQF